MHDGMPYDRSKVKVKVTELLKISRFQVYLLHGLQLQLANDHWFLKYSTISKFDQVVFLLICPSFVSHDLELVGVPADSPSTKKFFSDFNEI